MNYKILLPLFVDQAFTYKSDSILKIGQIVYVPFQNKYKYGVVWDIGEANPTFTVKSIEHKTNFILSEKIIDFVKWISKYTLSPESMIIRMILSIKKIEEDIPLEEYIKPNFESIALSDEQKKALNEIEKIIQNKSSRPILLDGITGSGKTEVYLEVANQTLKKDQQILILVPEIALTKQLIDRIKKKFGLSPYIWHSKTPQKRRQITWLNSINDRPMITIGARSALFLPFSKLGLIIVDEEHETSYKQESQVIYQSRDMAIVRAHLENIPIILSSATPSIETFHNAKIGRYHHIQLKNRYGEAQYPTTQSIDLKHISGLLSETLKEAINQTLSKKKQVLLFLNRRGYAPSLLCKKCGYKLPCKNCSTNLVFHKKSFKLICHHCAYQKDYQKQNCPSCNTTLIPWGPGVEKINEEVKNFFPTARVLIMTSDTLTSEKKLNESMAKITNKEIDIIIGTQILAKGHHFPDLTLVGIIDADMGLNNIDLRAAEHTYQLLHQVAGRCGREKDKGHVIIQTFNDQSNSIQALLNWNREKFMEQEIHDRQIHNMPPFSYLASIIFSGRDEKNVLDFALKLKKLHPPTTNIQIFGPSPASLHFLKGQYRYRFLIKSNQPGWILQKFLKQWLSIKKCPHSIKCTVDINPQSFF